MLKNKTKKTILVSNLEKAESFHKKALGLMFSKRKDDYALVFYFSKEETIAASVHMLFVFYPIDLFYLDKNKKVVDIKRNFRPFSLNYTPKKPSKYLVEVASGVLKENQVALGDILDW